MNAKQTEKYEIVDGETENTYFLYPPDYDTYTGHVAEIHGPNADEEAKLFANAPETLRQRDALLEAIQKFLECCTRQAGLYSVGLAAMLKFQTTVISIADCEATKD